MVQRSALYNVEMIKNRLFRGGQIFPVWQIFRYGQLTGNFIFSGQDWTTTIEMNRGKVATFIYQEDRKRISGVGAFDELRRSIRSDETTRFSILVSDKAENE